jgi:hypothetical protein
MIMIVLVTFLIYHHHRTYIIITTATKHIDLLYEFMLSPDAVYFFSIKMEIVIHHYSIRTTKKNYC